jgi:hypothetical protein
VNEIEERVAAARARKAAADTRRTEAEAAAMSLADVEKLEREAADAEAVADAIGKHGAVGSKIAVVDTDMGCVIVKRSGSALFRRFQDQGKFDTGAFDKLVRPCVVHPDAARLDAILDELPATLSRLANAVVELAGARSAELAGK